MNKKVCVEDDSIAGQLPVKFKMVLTLKVHSTLVVSRFKFYEFPTDVGGTNMEGSKEKEIGNVFTSKGVQGRNPELIGVECISKTHKSTSSHKGVRRCYDY